MLSVAVGFDKFPITNYLVEYFSYSDYTELNGLN